MENKDTSHGLRHGQALALQYAMQALINLTCEPCIIPKVLTGTQLSAPNAVGTAALGCKYTAMIMLPFVVELALKALIAKHQNGEVKSGHSLCKLHNTLPEDVQKQLNNEFFSVFSREKDERNLRQILCCHDTDFQDWRYLDNANSLPNDSIYTLQYVVCAVLNVYNND